MKLKLGEDIYDICITKKISNKNTYLRVKDDLKIYITTNTFTSNKEIENIILKNQDAIKKMITKVTNKKNKQMGFFYLGKKYDIIKTSNSGIALGQEKFFVNKDFNNNDLEKWYKKEALKIFQERFEICYNNFTEKIPYPSLTIRKMKTRWGVCNTRNKRVTLNLELIKKPVFCLDYVIIHELSHLIHPNHSKKFWLLVEDNCKDYKQIRKLMKED